MDGSSWWDWLAKQMLESNQMISDLLSWLDPRNWMTWIWLKIEPFFDWLKTILPPPADMSDVFDGATTFWYYVRPVYALANHFINIPMLAFVIGFCMLIELVLVGPSIWRFVIKMIPFAG